MAAQMGQTLPLRQVASTVGVHLSTAFRWRHRWLEARCQGPQEALEGDVAVCLTVVRYSEKGSRTCRGPGSWGYWDWLRRGPRPEWMPPQEVGRGRFRRFIDGRPSCVLLVRSTKAHACAVLGPKRRVEIGADFLKPGLEALVAPDARVWGIGQFPYREACERLNLTYCDPSAGGEAEKDSSQPVEIPENPVYWLKRFRAVATKYLHHYTAWFSFQVTAKLRASAE